uniref:Uncharacterized protein n=1 Tax=Lactuca sativa TaxID=4236 RepID=A0A9R1W213_LACSA|nr:hypothetical protein LSAT_V11C300140610 [Lactuca sativa]
MQGLVDAVEERFSGAKFENLFWRASKATTEAHFNKAMKDIEKLNHKAVKHLMDRDQKNWSLTFFRVHHSCEYVENGFSKSFNSFILDGWKKPIISMLEDIPTKWYGCVHLIATLSFLNVTPDRPYVDSLYLVAFFHNTYKNSISVMNGMHM